MKTEIYFLAFVFNIIGEIGAIYANEIVLSFTRANLTDWVDVKRRVGRGERLPQRWLWDI